MKVIYNPKYNKAPGNSIEEITFRNITYDGVGENPSLIKGIDENHSVRNITFENVVINGKRMKDVNEFITNEFIKDIKVK